MASATFPELKRVLRKENGNKKTAYF